MLMFPTITLLGPKLAEGGTRLIEKTSLLDDVLATFIDFTIA
jgi:hypothetical protein